MFFLTAKLLKVLSKQQKISPKAINLVNFYIVLEHSNLKREIIRRVRGN